MWGRQLSAPLATALDPGDQGMCSSELHECVQQKPLTFPTGNHSWCLLTLVFISFLFLVGLLRAYQRVVIAREQPQHHWRGLSPPAVFFLVTAQPNRFDVSLSLGLLPRLASKHFEMRFCVLPSQDRIPSWSDPLLGRNIPKPKCNNKNETSLLHPVY